MADITDRIFHDSNLIAVYADQTPHTSMRFGTDLQHNERRLGYVKITDLADASKREALIESIVGWLAVPHIERYKIAALRECAPKIVANLLRKTSGKTELLAQIFSFLPPEEGLALLEEIPHAQHDKWLPPMLCEKLDIGAIGILYDQLLKRPELSVDQIFEPLARQVRRHGEIQREWPLMHFNPISIMKADALAAYALQPRRFAENLLDEMQAAQSRAFCLPAPEQLEANAARERQFLRHFEKLPGHLKELFVLLDKKTVIGSGDDAYALTRTPAFNNYTVRTKTSAFNDYEVLTAFFCPAGNDIVYSGKAADRFSTISEEITHAVEKELMPGRISMQESFTGQPSWRKAVDRHLLRCQNSAAFQKIKTHYTQTSGKSNRFYSRRQPSHIDGRYAEALPDVMRIEQTLCDLVREHGNLACIGFKPEVTVEQALLKGMGDLYLLYRHTPQNRRLWQKGSGEVFLAGADENVEGAMPVQSFQDRCLERIYELSGKTIAIEPHPPVDPEAAPARLHYPRTRGR